MPGRAEAPDAGPYGIVGAAVSGGAALSGNGFDDAKGSAIMRWGGRTGPAAITAPCRHAGPRGRRQVPDRLGQEQREASGDGLQVAKFAPQRPPEGERDSICPGHRGKQGNEDGQPGREPGKVSLVQG